MQVVIEDAVREKYDIRVGTAELKAELKEGMSVATGYIKRFAGGDEI
jgi:hypothetical protein